MCHFRSSFASSASKFNRRKRKFLAALSFTSGITMLLMMHQASINAGIEVGTGMESLDMAADSNTEFVLKSVQTTNDTPVDYFVGNTEQVHPTSFRGDEALDKEKESQIVVPEPSVSKFLGQNPTESPVNGVCCKDDFHQSPYVTMINPENFVKNNKLKTANSQIKTPSSRNYKEYYRIKRKPRRREINFKKSITNKIYIQKSAVLENNMKETIKIFEKNEKAFLNQILPSEYVKNGNTIININIENFLHNPQVIAEENNSNKKNQKETIVTPMPEIKIFPTEYFNLLEEQQEIKDNYNVNRKPIIKQFNKINIPELTLGNVSNLVAVKQENLRKIIEKIKTLQLFDTPSQVKNNKNSDNDTVSLIFKKDKSSFLERDLSQWNDLLVLPEENIENTYEPNDGNYKTRGIYSTEPVEEETQRNSEASSTKTGNNSGSGADNKNKSDKKYIRNLFSLMRNSLPNAVLRDLPRYRIRKSFHPHDLENNYIPNEDPQLQNTAVKTMKHVVKLSPEAQKTSTFQNVLYPFHLDYTRPAYFPWRSTNDECSNHATRFLLGGTGRIVAIASFPGSGNTWFRYIVETITGVFTGSLYEDDILAMKGFWGERDSYIEGTTLLQKTHSFPALPEEVTEWDGRMILGNSIPRKIVLLIRSPYEALVSLRHFHAAGHTGFGHHTAFSGSGWDNFTEVRSESWLKLNKAWLELPDSKVIVIHYEKLMQNIETESLRLLEFLEIPVDYGRLNCLLRYQEGKFRRPRYPKHLQGYEISKKAASLMASSITTLNQILAYHSHQTLPTQLYSYHPQTKAPPTMVIANEFLN